MQERHCNKNCCTPQSGQSSNLAYALYYQLENISVAANDGIDFPLTAAESAGNFLSDGNQVQILKPGVYYVHYIVHLPAEEPLTTTFALQANRQNVTGTERSVSQTATSSAVTVIAETMLNVCTPVSIRVVSTAAAAITGEEGEVLSSLLIVQLA